MPGEIEMSWNQTPMSPRKSKLQQQSWEETPTINLYDSHREFYDSMPLAGVSSQVKKSPTNQSRRINYNKYLPNPKHQISDPGTYYNMATNVKSPKSPREQTFEFELSTPPHTSRSPLKSVGSNRRFYEDTLASDSAPATLISQRKYEFGAVSPSHGKNMKKVGLF